MKATVFIAYILLLMDFVVGVAFIYLFVLLVRALRKYIKSEPVRKEKAESAKSLGEVIKRLFCSFSICPYKTSSS